MVFPSKPPLSQTFSNNIIFGFRTGGLFCESGGGAFSRLSFGFTFGGGSPFLGKGLPLQTSPFSQTFSNNIFWDFRTGVLFAKAVEVLFCDFHLVLFLEGERLFRKGSSPQSLPLSQTFSNNIFLGFSHRGFAAASIHGLLNVYKKNDIPPRFYTYRSLLQKSLDFFGKYDIINIYVFCFTDVKKIQKG